MTIGFLEQTRVKCVKLRFNFLLGTMSKLVNFEAFVCMYNRGL